MDAVYKSELNGNVPVCQSACRARTNQEERGLLRVVSLQRLLLQLQLLNYSQQPANMSPTT